MIELIRKQPIFCLFALFLLLLTVILLLKLGKFLLFSKGRLRRRSLSQSSRDLTRPSPVVCLRLPGLRARQGPLRPWRSLEGAPTSGASSLISQPHGMLGCLVQACPGKHSTLRMRKPRRARLPPGLLFWPLAAANFFSIILEHLSGGRVCSLGENPSRSDPKDAPMEASGP
jgi:hypothetical protein